ncbi:hypothetical protein Q8F55_006290 [Vanrija albida]|uniref:Nitrogen regulatory protein areA GATA-like domain-containing protein n=1 Tax=Vanrija albida TaxID=181172 RepID=A0ABR3PWQ6_9TREE
MPSPPSHFDAGARASASSASSGGSSRSPSRQRSAAPLLTLAPITAEIRQPEVLAPEQQDLDVKDIWNVISRASDIVKDGSRLENLAWRHWGSPNSRRRSSSSTTASSASLHTPSDHSTTIPRSRSFERRSFTGALKLLIEENSFKDWVEAAKRNPPPAEPKATSTPRSSSLNGTPAPRPSLALPDTPIADVEIRLVEPTPVPSRVGSLGGTGSQINSIVKPSVASFLPEGIHEEPEAEARNSATTSTPMPPRRKQQNRFFIQTSPGKVSGSDSSLPSSAPQAAEPEPAPPPPAPTGISVSSHGRSSGDSSSAIVIRPPARKERRHVTMANMRGRFAGEKARAAEAIAARNKKDSSDDEEWEDEDGSDVDEEDVDEEQVDGDDDGEWEDDDPSTAEPSPAPTHLKHKSRASRVTLPPPPPPAPTPPKTKRERAAEKARIEAEKDAQRKREMFAKQQIFGAPKAAQGEGLLTRTFRSGKSMIDLTQIEEDDTGAPSAALRRAPTHGTLTNLGRSPGPAPSGLARTKSAVAMPVQSGVSVTSRSHVSGTGTSEERRPSGPDGVEMESSDEDSEDDNYLASSQVQRKLDELAAKREKRVMIPQLPPSALASVSDNLDEQGVVRPLSPTTRRRTIIMREMSESLRRNIILEREKSSGRTNNFGQTRPPPSVHTSRLPTVSSAVNLAQYGGHHVGYGAPLQRQRSQTSDVNGFATQPPGGGGSGGGVGLERTNSQPNLAMMPGQQLRHPHAPSSPNLHPQASVSPETKRRGAQNVLGSGFLRPLTRATTTSTISPTLERTQSSVALNTSPSPHAELSSPSPTGQRAGSNQFVAPAMVRSSTEDLERARHRRELARRSEHTDTSYRMHGW